MTFTLDQIDELKKRANVSYGDAKEALEQCNGDLLDAVIYLEQQNKIKPEPKSDCSILNKFKNLLKKANNTRFVMKKKDRTVLDLSVTVSIIMGAFASYIVIPVLLLALFTGHRMKFEGKNGEDIKVNEALSKISNAVDSAKKKLVDEEQNTVAQ